MLKYSLTPEQIEAEIASVDYQRFSKTGTLCVITLVNGYTVTGESSCIDPSNFDEEIGKHIAFANAYEQLWKILGYQVKTKWHRETQLTPKDRVREELADLDEKRSKLNAMLLKSKPEFIPQVQWNLMQDQYDVMSKYSLILAERLEKM